MDLTGKLAVKLTILICYMYPLQDLLMSVQTVAAHHYDAKCLDSPGF